MPEIDELGKEQGLSFERLRSFLRVATAGGIAKAAPGDLGRQSLYSRQIRELSGYFGVDLVRRSGKGIIVTPEGKRLADLLRTQFTALEDLRESWNNRPMQFTIGAGESLLHWLVLPRVGSSTVALSADIQDDRPVFFAVRNLRTAEIHEGLHDQSLDFGLLRKPEVTDAFNSIALGSLEFALFVPRRLVQKLSLGSASPKEVLAKIPLATLPAGVGLRRELDRILGGGKERFLPSLVCESLPQAERALIAGTHGAILPTLAKDTYLDQGAIVELQDQLFSTLRRTIMLVWPVGPDAGRLYSPVVARHLGAALKF